MRALIVAMLAAAAAAPAAAGDIAITRPWSRATAPDQAVGVAYATLQSAAGDTLLGVASPDAGSAMLHKTESLGGMGGPMGNMVGMADLDAIELPPGKAVALAPGGMHVMLMGLKHPLVRGQSVTLTFTFRHAGAITVPVPIAGLGANAP